MGGYSLLKIDDADSLALLGEGTKWCTRKSYPNCQAETYIANHDFIFIISKDDKPFIQLTSHFDEAMDINNEDVNLVSFRGLLKPLEPWVLTQGRDDSQEGNEHSTPVYYALRVVGGRWPEAEPIILKTDDVVYYAEEVIGGRWPEAEPIILNILKNPDSGNDIYSVVHYAKDIIGGRWPEAEPYIMKDPSLAVYYAEVIGSRWPEAEPYIMKNSKEAYIYATYVIKGRWPEAEPYIMQSRWADSYKAMIIRNKKRLGL
jgi:hypothetical protein